MYAQSSHQAHPTVARQATKILVIDDDDATATAIAALLPQGACEVIACSDMALAEVATDITDFDLILVAPWCTGVDGLEGLTAADFLLARNPSAVAAFLVPPSDADLRAAALDRGGIPVLSKPLLNEELLALWTALDGQQVSVGAA